LKNLSQMLKAAQTMQVKMQEIQQELEAAEIEGQACGGLVRVVLSGKSDMKSLYIEPSLFDGEDKEVIEDLIATAHNDARQKVEALAKEKMAGATGGLSLPPGMDLPV